MKPFPSKVYDKQFKILRYLLRFEYIYRSLSMSLQANISYYTKLCRWCWYIGSFDLPFETRVFNAEVDWQVCFWYRRRNIEIKNLGRTINSCLVCIFYSVNVEYVFVKQFTVKLSSYQIGSDKFKCDKQRRRMAVMRWWQAHNFFWKISNFVILILKTNLVQFLCKYLLKSLWFWISFAMFLVSCYLFAKRFRHSFRSNLISDYRRQTWIINW